MDVESVGTIPPPEPPRSDTRTQPADGQAQQTTPQPAQQPMPQPAQQPAPLPEASGWNVDLFA